MREGGTGCGNVRMSLAAMLVMFPIDFGTISFFFLLWVGGHVCVPLSESLNVRGVL